jgi:hypothetical protein
MQVPTGFAPGLVPSFLVIFLVSLGGLCVAQEIDPPGGTRGPLFAPTGYLELIVPPQPRVGLKLYGFYAGEVKAPVAQLDVNIRTTKFLTITPSYLYVAVPPSGLSAAVSRPGVRFTRTYEENQFRIDGTLKFTIHKFEILERNMYVRRFRPAGQNNRYRNRIEVARPLVVKGRAWRPFASYEAFYDWGLGGWTRNRVWSGVMVTLQKHVALQPSYVWDSTRGLRDINYLLIAVIFRTK